MNYGRDRQIPLLHIMRMYEYVCARTELRGSMLIPQ